MKGDDVSESIDGRTVRADRSTGELVKQAAEQLSDLIRAEFRLAQAEMAEKGRRAGVGGGYLGGAGVVGFVALQAAAATAIIALDLVLSLWQSALAVTALLLLIAGVLALNGRRQLKRATPPAPRLAIGEMRTDVEEIKKRAHR